MNILEMLDRPIAFQRSFVRLTGSINAALMLSQAVYWTKRSSTGDGWFYKTRDEWEEETGMTRYEQEGARKLLLAKGLIVEKKKGVPCKLYFQVDTENLALQLGENQPTSRGNTPHLVGGKPTSKLGENQPTITETTAETTTETTPKGGVQDFAIRFSENYPRPLFDDETEIERQKAFCRESTKISGRFRGNPALAAEWLIGRMESYVSSAYVQTADRQYLPYARNWLMNKEYDKADGSWNRRARKTNTLPFADFNTERAQLERII